VAIFTKDRKENWNLGRNNENSLNLNHGTYEQSIKIGKYSGNKKANGKNITKMDN